uniref:Reverse transcriptase domain-containing protein n=1 Tax=Meloidogyne enterolobii TaxID=390850 RepID=A0A6V7XCA6_MELEN|nr:unnamed protein product [Meloidogyne enterolobii]
MRFINAYVPPKTTDIILFDLISILTDLLSVSYPIIITGDFNLPSINWLADNDSNNIFKEFVKNADLHQLITFSTRSKNILDLLITNNPGLIDDILSLPPMSSSDHSSFSFSVTFKNEPSELYYRLNYLKGDYNSLNYAVANTDWNNIFKSIFPHNLDTIYSTFTQITKNFIENFIPITNCSSLNLPNHLQKIDTYRAQLWKDIHKADIKSKFLYVNKRFNKELKKYLIYRENKLIKSKNSKRIFNYISSQVKSNSFNIPTILDIKTNNVFSTDLAKANYFALYFKSIFHKQNLPHPLNLQNLNTNTLNYIDISEADVFDKLIKLTLKVNTSPDCLNNYILKKCAGSLTQPITQIFRYSMMTGTLPSIWTHSNIIPLFKKGDKSLASNYRPIALTCTLVKVLEKIIKDNLIVRITKYLPTSQHGFIKSKSIVSQLLEAHDDWTKALDENLCVDIIYFDFIKAFDKVSHTILLKKLTNIGIGNPLLFWIENFLRYRTYSVKINNAFSENHTSNMGVPQGSVLGPILFIFFIHDLVKFCATHDIIFKFFADDFKAYLIHSNCNKRFLLQNCISKIEIWSAENELEISAKKCNVLYLGKNNSKFPYYISNNKITPIISFVRDLGILTSSSLKWTIHIDYIKKRAYTRLFTLFKAIKSNDPNFLTKAYTSYVRPIIESFSQLFNPYLKSEIKKLEDVQKMAVKIIYFRGLQNLYPTKPSYEDLLMILNLKSIKDRFLINDIMCYHKIIHGYISIGKSHYPKLTKSNTRNQIKINSSHSNLNLRHHFFFEKMARIYPKLPNELFKHQKIQNFRTCLNKIDLSSIKI